MTTPQPPETKPTKAIVAGLVAVADGLAVLITAGTLHGDARVGVLALIAAIHTMGVTYGVWRVPNAPKN